MKNPTNFLRALLCVGVWTFSISAQAGLTNEDSIAKPDISRFDINDGEAYDKETNLTWSRCSVGQHWAGRGGCAGAIKGFTFEEAQSLSDKTWRVPTKDELTTIIDIQRKNSRKKPVVDIQVFPNMDDGMLVYWTSIPTNSVFAWGVYFGRGMALSSTTRSVAASVRLVHDGR